MQTIAHRGARACYPPLWAIRSSLVGPASTLGTQLPFDDASLHIPAGHLLERTIHRLYIPQHKDHQHRTNNNAGDAKQLPDAELHKAAEECREGNTDKEKPYKRRCTFCSSS